MRAENWDAVLRERSVNSQYKLFLNTYTYYFNQSFPIRRRTAKTDKHDAGWVNAKVRETSKNLRDLYHFSKVNNLQNLYDIEKQKHKVLITQTKQDYYNNLIVKSDNKSKAVCNIINKNKQQKQAITINIDNVLITDGQLLADLFLKHFSQTSSNSSSPRDVCCGLDTVSTCFCFQQVRPRSNECFET